MLILISIFTILHTILYIWLIVGWNRIENQLNSNNKNTFSVIIPARNEQYNIDSLLKHLSDQSYPKTQFEIIVVDDFSEDKTSNTVQKWISKNTMNLRFIQLTDKHKQGKKHAITAGVEIAKYPIIITTDADCRMGENWISSYNQMFNSKVKMVTGPVGITGEGLFARFQQTEFAGLIGFGAVTISSNNPTMCSGANLAFRKEVFKEVSGYEDNLFTPSGDDEFMLHSVMSLHSDSVKFMKMKDAVVYTPSQNSWQDFQNQRIRWSSKWKHNRNLKARFFSVLFFFDYLLIYILLLGLFMGWFEIWFASLVIATRFLVNYIFGKKINSFLGGKPIFLSVLFLQILYPAHVLLMGVKSIFGKYTWKGRNY